MSIIEKIYQCEECGFQYAEKEWAEKCEAWCKEHHSCNIEITAHAIPKEKQPPESVEETKSSKPGDIRFLTRLFYGLVGVVASLAFFLILYWSLRTNSSIASLIGNTYSTPLYFWPYVILTFAAIILFGVNASLFVYRWRRFGFALRSFSEGGAASGGGSLLGVAASACPVCGSVLLSAIGVAGGLAAFPLGGLELKALSVGLLALPIWLTTREMKKIACADGVCVPVNDHSFKEERDRPWLLRLAVFALVLMFVSWNMLKTDPAVAQFVENSKILNPGDNKLNTLGASATGNKLFDEVTAKVLPEKGFQSKIVLEDSVVKLVQNGVIERDKFLAIYQDRGGLPDELNNILDKPSQKPILLTRKNANYYVNLMWPIGLANYMSSNKESPVNGKSLFNFSSTGGWNLGKEENGGAYFNKLNIVELTAKQEALVVKIAQNTYRPCCNNSTFFQDCNHGSALLGMLQLGASQGVSEEELYKEALAFNSFWFPQNYIQTALYFKVVENTEWDMVDPKVVMGKDFSAISGWYANVDAEVKRLGLVPQQEGGAGCGV